MLPSIRLIPCWFLAFCLIGECCAEGPLRFDPPELDLGELRTGQEFEHRVKLVNQGPTPIEVRAVTASCGCLRVRQAPARVPAGGAAEVHLAVHTLSAPAGQQNWQVNVAWAGPAGQQALALPVRATVRQEVVLQPPMLRVNSAGATRHELVVVDQRPNTFRIVRAVTSSPYLRISEPVERTDAAGRRVRALMLTIDGQLPAGRHEEQVVIHTDDPVHRELRVLVDITRRGGQRVEALPEKLELVLATADAQASRVVVLRDLRGRPVEIESIETSHPALSARGPEGEAATASIRLEVRGELLKQDRLQGEIVVRMVAPAGEKVTIPVTVLRR
jgi:hypothetical protein